MSGPESEHSVLSQISQAIITIRGSSLHCPLAKPQHVAGVASLSIFLSAPLSWNVGPGAEKLFVTKLRAQGCSHQSPVPAAEWCEMSLGLATHSARVVLVTKLAEETQH